MEQEDACIIVACSSHVPPAPWLAHTPSYASSLSDNTWNAVYQNGGPVWNGGYDGTWQYSTNDWPMEPKRESPEGGGFHMRDVQEGRDVYEYRDVHEGPGPAPPNPPSEETKPKRPRGRPRKHPLGPQNAGSKVAKARSKTGCITCRKRKKKCDEGKPRCFNCEKNAVVCEGYHEKTLWKSGREKEEQQERRGLLHITLPPIFQGIETPEDRVFFGHYVDHLSSVLTVEGPYKNAFKDMMLQMAIEHHGLMHSILALSGKHVDFNGPYGIRLLYSNPHVSLTSLMDRAQYHHDSAMKQLLEWGRTNEGPMQQKSNLAPRYAQMLCLLLQTAAEGTADGSHRVHLQAYKSLIHDNPPSDKQFTTFITEFFQYRVFVDELIRYPDRHTRRLVAEDWEPWVEIDPARLIGVGDGLFSQMAKITTIRDSIRANLIAGIEPAVDSSWYYRAIEIERAIHEWEPTWPIGDGRNRVSLLYQQMMWIYLRRTIDTPPTSIHGPPLFVPVTRPEAFGHMGGMVNFMGDFSRGMPPSPIYSQHSSITLSPPLSTIPPPVSDYRVSRGSYHAPTTPFSAFSDSPPPPMPLGLAYPPPYQHHEEITLAVDESLAIIESFKLTDSVQTLLLVPSLVIGCAAFTPAQQERVRIAIRTVYCYTGLRNCHRVLDVVEEVWRLMACGEWGRVWDWQAVIKSMGLDFSCA
ncbi:fungal-specific transcription factor domain-containing protein [Xylaria sp. CBS 124048]|nr:fungal-specific transcription factor domain-containing protein [Xylaria sp. CBS 124048]